MLKSVTLLTRHLLENVVTHMERIVFQKLVEWKDSATRKPLVLNGARQVGKTWLLEQLGKQYFKKVAYLVCRKNQTLKDVFSLDFDTDRILRALRALSGVDITPGDTLIVLDEVQDIPEAIESLKYFCEEAPEYHIAVAGSLLGISLHRDISYPVGKIDEINVYPLNFDEFLLAKGETEAYKLLKDKDFHTTNLIHEKYTDLLRQYYYVGGMPEAVKVYIETDGLQAVRNIQKAILNGYERDFSKHAPKDQIARIRLVWQTLPSQLFKENKKFIYGSIKHGARAKDFEIAIQWLVDAGLVYKVPLCKEVKLPLKVYEDPSSTPLKISTDAVKLPLKVYEDPSAFKLFTLDLGLLGAMVGTEASQVLVKNDIFSEYKGGMTEQFILEEMKSHGEENIFYHKTDDGTRLEIDFLIQRNGKLLPIEVKAEGNVRANSLSNLLKQTPELHAIRYSMKPYIEQPQMTCYPLYAIQ